MFQIGNVKKKENLIFNSPCQTWAEVLNSVDLTAATDKKFTNANLLHSKPEICSHIWNWKSWLEFLKWWEEFIAFKTEICKHMKIEILAVRNLGLNFNSDEKNSYSRIIDPDELVPLLPEEYQKWSILGFNEFVLGHGQIYSR